MVGLYARSRDEGRPICCVAEGCSVLPGCIFEGNNSVPDWEDSLLSGLNAEAGYVKRAIFMEWSK
jgi:hypothetical protein